MPDNGIVKVLQSRSGGEAHTIRRDEYGNLFCSCMAAEHNRECWALKAVSFDILMEKLTKASRQVRLEIGVKIPDIKKLQAEQWDYVLQSRYRRKW